MGKEEFERTELLLGEAAVARLNRASVAVFGIGGVLSLPALFVLGVQSILSARALAARVRGEGKGRVLWGRDCLVRCALCLGAVCVCILLERTVVPALLSGAAGALLNR